MTLFFVGIMIGISVNVIVYLLAFAYLSWQEEQMIKQTLAELDREFGEICREMMSR